MGDGQGATRMNVSVPRELKARMDVVGRAVNWSAVAQAAFEVKLQELESTKGVRSMNEVIQRLKAAADLEANEEHQEGRKAGERWARQRATPKQLARLWEAETTDGVIRGAPNHLGWPGLIHYVLSRVKEMDRSDIQAFWGRAIGVENVSRLHEVDFARGFVDGALSVWEQVRDKL